jgi:hypothetical protein
LYGQGTSMILQIYQEIALSSTLYYKSTRTPLGSNISCLVFLVPYTTIHLLSLAVLVIRILLSFILQFTGFRARRKLKNNRLLHWPKLVRGKIDLLRVWECCRILTIDHSVIFFGRRVWLLFISRFGLILKSAHFRNHLVALEWNFPQDWIPTDTFFVTWSHPFKLRVLLWAHRSLPELVHNNPVCGFYLGLGQNFRLTTLDDLARWFFMFLGIFTCWTLLSSFVDRILHSYCLHFHVLNLSTTLSSVYTTT